MAATRILEATSLEALYAEIAPLNYTAGWLPRDPSLLPRQPTQFFLPAHWSYADAKAILNRAGGLISVEQAERRNLVMVNPSPIADWEALRTISAAYQMILPGEIAPAHRHTSHALRVIVDAEQSFSIVDGEKIAMNSGDVILTPGASWHGHEHFGDAPGYWMDFLDVPLTHFLEPLFFETHPQKHQPVLRVTDRSPFRFSQDDIARRIERESVDPEGFHGASITLEAGMMPTLSLQIERLPTNCRTRPYRTTANILFNVMQGEGESEIGDDIFAWKRGDTFVAPGWNRICHRATADAQFLALSDAPLFEFCRYLRLEDLS